MFVRVLQHSGVESSTYCQIPNTNQIPNTTNIGEWVIGGSEIVRMWKDYFKRILNSEISANEFAESVEHSIVCKENYLGREIPTCSVISLTSLLQKLPFNKAPGPVVFL